MVSTPARLLIGTDEAQIEYVPARDRWEALVRLRRDPVSRSSAAPWSEERSGDQLFRVVGG